MKIVHCVPHINQEASGPSYSVPRLCQGLVEAGDSVELKCLAASRRIPGVVVTIHEEWPGFGRFAVSSEMAKALMHSARVADIVHSHSLWSMTNIAVGWTVPGHKAKLVVSPRGTLSRWSLDHSRWIKSCLWPLQRRALRRADLLHATSEMEYDEIRALGFRAPVAIVPNGVDLPIKACVKVESVSRTLLFLSRIHSKKGVEELLYAWKNVFVKHRNWRLLIVGTGEARYVKYVNGLARSMSLDRVYFTGPAFGDAKSEMYNQATLFVLPTHSENFGLVVAEALAHACPVVVTRGAPWAELQSEGCGWWIPLDVGSLSDALDTAMQQTAHDLRAMGERGRSWMKRDFAWGAIARKMNDAYRWLLEGGECPAWIRVDY